MSRPKKLTDEQRLENKRKNIKIQNDKNPYSSLNGVDRLFRAAKKRSKERGLEFNIEKSDIVIPEYCPYIGVRLTSNSKRGTARTTVASLDRIDSTLGYVKGNVEVISHLANTMKSNANLQQLTQFAKTVLLRYDPNML
jgi:hypothetical protein